MPDWYNANFVWYCWLALTGLWLIAVLMHILRKAEKKFQSVDIVQVIVEILTFIVLMGWLVYAVFKLFIE
ncbi:MAG: hypothetical protein CMJ79_04145 [Planctomycetaceae bacterium]|nr:hypothetical protein [Planctomycetaceae bacterium]|tara:strand:+ start:10084 stop:10293 length:210 start_codon:yes stop_codon:yes gene_type:complete